MRICYSILLCLLILQEKNALKVPPKLVRIWQSLLKVDLTCGVHQLSSPGIKPHNITIPSPLETDVSIVPAANFQSRLNKIGKNAVKRFPDNVLLGILVLISTELIKREVVSKPKYPPAVRELADSVIKELEVKIEYLSLINWNLDPLLQSEMLRLQTEPLEVIDKYLVSEILPNIDKELSPYFLKFTGDPKSVAQGIENIKDIITLISVLLVRYEDQPASLKKINGDFLKQIDQIGAQVERGVVSISNYCIVNNVK
jgi:hypothetical protein